MEENTMIIGGVAAFIVILIIIVLMYKKEGYGESRSTHAYSRENTIHAIKSDLTKNTPFSPPVLTLFVTPDLAPFLHAEDAFSFVDYAQNGMGQRAIFAYHVVEKLPGAGSEEDNMQIRVSVPGRGEDSENFYVNTSRDEHEVRTRFHEAHKSVVKRVTINCAPIHHAPDQRGMGQFHNNVMYPQKLEAWYQAPGF